MPWVRSHWRGDRIDSRSRGETEPSHFDEIQIVAKLIEKGVTREQLSTKYQNPLG